MRILLYSLNYAPELTGIGRYNTEMARWLTEQGHTVRVVSAPPYYPRWEIAEGYGGWRFQREVEDGVEVLRCPTYVPRRPSGLKRIVHLASFASSSVVALAGSLRWRPDVVMMTEPPLMCAPAALAFCTVTGARSWLHVQDLEIDAGFGLGFMRRPWLRRAVCAVERVLLRRFERLTTISSAMRTALVAKVGDDREVSLMRNWADLDAVRPVDASSLRASLGIPRDAIVCLYSGSMAAKQGLELLADVARRLAARRDIHFVFCGEGASREALRRASAGLERITFLDLQPTGRLSELLSMADIHLLPQRAAADGLVMPSKLSGIFASARPVIVTAAPGSELAHIVSDKGLVVPPEDAEAFAASVVELADDPVLRLTCGRVARAFAERTLDRHAILSEALDALAEAQSVDDDEAVPSPVSARNSER